MDKLNELEEKIEELNNNLLILQEDNDVKEYLKLSNSISVKKYNNTLSLKRYLEVEYNKLENKNKRR